jgi:hypothetical protein
MSTQFGSSTEKIAVLAESDIALTTKLVEGTVLRKSRQSLPTDRRAPRRYRLANVSDASIEIN